jgi:hypothetical protein
MISLRFFIDPEGRFEVGIDDDGGFFLLDHVSDQYVELDGEEARRFFELYERERGTT